MPNPSPPKLYPVLALLAGALVLFSPLLAQDTKEPTPTPPQLTS